jgi:hypothetical protein
MKMEKTGY